jgi:hypothetical protein
MAHRFFRITLVVCLLATLSAASAAQSPFTGHFKGQTYTTGPEPTGVVSGDFNRDGLPDLAVTDRTAGHINILLGVGGGQFALGAEYNAGLGPTQIVTGDFNHDGKLDLAVASADAIAIFLGNGDGTFHQGTSIALDGGPMALVAADFDRDGIPDLAVIDRFAAFLPVAFTLKILRSNGDGTFTRTQAISLPSERLTSALEGLLVSEDFNIDGLPDLALATDKTVMVFTDSAHGTMHLHSVFAPPNTAFIVGLAAGRLTRDAAPDLVVRVFDNPSRPPFPNSEYVFLNSGFGSFHLRSRVPGANLFVGIYLTDINGDGLADLVSVGSNTLSNPFDIFLGHGDGTFTGIPTEVVGAAPLDVRQGQGGLVARDLNLDSRHDLVFAGFAEVGTGAGTEVLLNQNAQSNCRPPGSATLAVRICSPRANATVESRVTVAASGNSPAGVKRVELWADGVKRAQSINDQLRVTIHLSPGTHHLTVVGIDLYDSLAKKTIVVFVL